jgi:hypothetical protein
LPSPARGTASAGLTTPSTPNPAAQDFLDRLALSGVRLAGANSSILVAGKVFVPGDLINADLKLKLVAIAPREIIFADESGTQYHKRF